jgi:hypothetical protein
MAHTADPARLKHPFQAAAAFHAAFKTLKGSVTAAFLLHLPNL